MRSRRACGSGSTASPEPVSNILASLTEDGLVAVVDGLLARHSRELAAAIALVLLIAGITLVVLIWTRIRRALAALRERRRGPP